MAEYLEAKHVLAVASGTAAMHLALVALGIGEGDEVITTPITWPATANVIVHTGATPVFVDVREGDLNIDPALIAAAVTERTKAIMPVHLAGQPCDMDPICALGIPVVEDAAHAAESALPRPQARRALRRDVLLALRDEEHRRGRGRARLDEPRRRRGRGSGDLRLMRRGDGSLYDITCPATRRTSPTCSRRSRSSSSTSCERHAEIRERQFALYDEGLAGLDGIEPLARDPRDTHALHLYVVRIDAERAGVTRDELQRALAEERIATSIHFLPVHRLTWYRERYPGSRRCRSPSGRATRSCRCRSRPRTPTTTSRM